MAASIAEALSVAMFVDSDSSWACRVANWPVAKVEYTTLKIVGDPCQGWRVEKSPFS
jgi:hypothetical protein